MLGVIDTKVYAFISLISAALLWAIDFFDKNEAAVTWLQTQARIASGTGLGRAVGSMIIQPIIFAIDGPVGAIIAGILWPLFLLWLLLLVLLLSFVLIAPGIFKARGAIGG